MFTIASVCHVQKCFYLTQLRQDKVQAEQFQCKVDLNYVLILFNLQLSDKTHKDSISFLLMFLLCGQPHFFSQPLKGLVVMEQLPLQTQEHIILQKILSSDLTERLSDVVLSFQTSYDYHIMIYWDMNISPELCLCVPLVRDHSKMPKL